MHHGLTCSKVVVSHPHQNCVELIPIVAVVSWLPLSCATDDANGFPSHVTDDEESHIWCQGVKLQGINNQLVMGLRVCHGDVTKPWLQEAVVLLCPDGHFISDAVNGKFEVIVVQQVVCSVSLRHWCAIACPHQFLLPGDQNVLQSFLICWPVQWF